MAQARNPDRFAEMVARNKRVEPERWEVAAALFAEHLDLVAIRLALGHKETAQLPAPEAEPPRPLAAPGLAPRPLPGPIAVPPTRSTRGLRLIGAATLGIAAGVALGLLWFTFLPIGAQTPATMARYAAPAELASTALLLAEGSKSNVQIRQAEIPALSPRFDIALPIVMAAAPMPPATPAENNAPRSLPSLMASPVRIVPSRPAPPRNAPPVLSPPIVTAVAPILTTVRGPAFTLALSLSPPDILQIRTPAPLVLAATEVPPSPPSLVVRPILTPASIINAPHPRPVSSPPAIFAARTKSPTAPTPRLVVHYGAARPPPARGPIETKLRAAGFSRVEWRAVPFVISRTNARFFHTADGDVTDKVIAALEGSGYAIDARDFRHFVPLPALGTIELWLAR